MSTNLYAAHKQWAARPADERFETLSALHSAVTERDNQSQEGRIYTDRVSLEVNGNIILKGEQRDAALTHWSAGQLLQRLGVPRDLLAKLEPNVATAVVMDRLPKSITEGALDRRQRVLLGGHGTDASVLRALHGDRYERLWDKTVTSTLLEYLPQGWRNPVAFKGGEWGAELVPSGLYAGDRDMFAFFVDGGDWADKPVGSFDVDGDGFNRGFYVWNSEVGAKTFGFTTFMFRVVCGNNIVWGASGIHTFSARHAGNANDVLRGFRRYLSTLNENQSADAFVTAVRDAKEHIAVAIAAKRDTTLEDAFTKFKGKFTQTEITDALDAILREEKGARGSRWDWLQGFTAVARTKQNADDKTDMESKASKLLLVTH